MSVLRAVPEAIDKTLHSIDGLSIPEDQRTQIKIVVKKVESEIMIAQLDREKEIASAQLKIAQSENQRQSWIQSNWRPVTMLTLLGLIVLNSLGVLEVPLNENAWTLIQIGLGGYVVGRSAEKIAPMMRRQNR